MPIEFIKSFNFSSLPYLFGVDLSFSSISGFSFSDLFSPKIEFSLLSKLSFRSTFLNINSSDLSLFWQTLRDLDISSCKQIKFNENFLFERLIRIEKLFLHDLDLNSSFLEKKVNFSVFPELRVLDLGKNNLEFFPSHMLESNKNLRVLVLNSNKLKDFTLPSKLFFPYCIDLLDLSYNNIEKIINKYLIQRELCVKNLILSNNFLETLLFKLYKPVYLDMSNNKLVNFDKFIYTVESLTFVNLSSNNLSAFPLETYNIYLKKKN